MTDAALKALELACVRAGMSQSVARLIAELKRRAAK